MDTPGPSKAIIEKMIKDSGLETRIGFFESALYPDGTPIAYIATIQEYGCPQKSIPPRPFMRPTIEKRDPEWKATMEKGAKRVSEGRLTMMALMEMIGLQAEGDTKATIDQVWSPPLSPITMMARKFKKEGGTITSAKQIGEFAKELKEKPNQDFGGVSNKPLNDSGAMEAHVTHLVVRP